jgi:hypothetical protein
MRQAKLNVFTFRNVFFPCFVGILELGLVSFRVRVRARVRVRVRVRARVGVKVGVLGSGLGLGD